MKRLKLNVREYVVFKELMVNVETKLEHKYNSLLSRKIFNNIIDNTVISFNNNEIILTFENVDIARDLVNMLDIVLKNSRSFLFNAKIDIVEFDNIISNMLLNLYEIL